VWPTGTPEPGTSNLNSPEGRSVANLVTVAVGAGGQVTLANGVGGVQVQGDIVGWYDDGTGPGDLYTGITPVRVLDSRAAPAGWSDKLAAGTPRRLAVTGVGSSGQVPSTATAVVANVTATEGTESSHLVVWASGVDQPETSNLLYDAGQNVAAAAIVKIGDDGAISFATAAGSVHVVVDVAGYFDPTAGGGRFYPLAPTRILDGRVGLGLTGPWGPDQSRPLVVAGTGTVASDAIGLVANVTAVSATGDTFVTAYPDGAPDPGTSNLNVARGATVANLVTVKVGTAGAVRFYNNLGSVDLVGDIAGFYAPDPVPT
jgi:hypothetical protein